MPEPRPMATPTTRMAKTQPLMSTPPATVQNAPIVLVPPQADSADGIDAIPISFCWALVGISAVTLLIQLWTYLA
jgi:hypothetical protein